MTNAISPLHVLILAVAGWLNRHQQRILDYLKEENRVFKEQLGGRRPRLTNGQRRRLAVKGKLLGRKLLGEYASLVTPDTILGWHRKLIARKWDFSQRRRGPGRPRVMDEIRVLVVRIARANVRWGYTRIQGALKNLGHEVGRTTVANILKERGLDGADRRQHKATWHSFLRSHWDCLVALDFFTIELWTPRGWCVASGWVGCCDTTTERPDEPGSVATVARTGCTRGAAKGPYRIAGSRFMRVLRIGQG